MSFKEFSSLVKIGTLQVETIIERASLEEGETLNGTLYLEDGEDEKEIDWIELKVLRIVEGAGQELETVIGKQSLEFAGADKSKESVMHQFEIIPDERWSGENENAKLVLRTTVFLMNGETAHSEDSFTYSTYEA